MSQGKLPLIDQESGVRGYGSRPGGLGPGLRAEMRVLGTQPGAPGAHASSEINTPCHHVPKSPEDQAGWRRG